MQRLIKRGLAKSRAELVDGTVVTGVDLARLLSHWSLRYTITRAGARAIGRRGRLARDWAGR